MLKLYHNNISVCSQKVRHALAEKGLEWVGHHVMLMGLKAPLKQGESFPLTLTFERAGSVEVMVSVEKIGATEPADHDHGSHDHGGHDHSGHGS